jgi:hypothetical protein
MVEACHPFRPEYGMLQADGAELGARLIDDLATVGDDQDAIDGAPPGDL